MFRFFKRSLFVTSGRSGVFIIDENCRILDIERIDTYCLSAIDMALCSEIGMGSEVENIIHLHQSQDKSSPHHLRDLKPQHTTTTNPTFRSTIRSDQQCLLPNSAPSTAVSSANSLPRAQQPSPSASHQIPNPPSCPTLRP